MVLQIIWENTPDQVTGGDNRFKGWGNDDRKYFGHYQGGDLKEMYPICKTCDTKIGYTQFTRCTECLDKASGHSGKGNF